MIKFLSFFYMFFNRGFCIFLLLFACSIICAQSPELKFEHFIDDKGLTQNTIMDVAQDKDGFLWIGTANGLYKYDGQRFTIYRNNPNQPNSIVNNVIHKLEVDENNVLWIGTVGGLCAYNVKKQQFFNSNKDLSDKDITAIYTDKSDGSVWVGTNKSGVYHISKPDTEEESVEHFIYQPNQTNTINSNTVLSIAKDRYDNLWIGTDKGVNRMFMSTSDSKNFMHVKGFDKPVNSMLLDKKGRLWLGERGTGVWSLEKPTSVHALDKISFKKHDLNLDTFYEDFGKINGIEEDVNGKLWIGVYGYGLYHLNTETADFNMYTPNDMYEESLSNRRIQTLLIDKTNVIWVGTEVGGLNKSDLQKKDIYFLSRNMRTNNTLSNASVNAILEDDDFLWIGTENGLNQIEFKDNYKLPSIKHHLYEKDSESNKSIKLQSIKSIFKDNDGDYWMGKDVITHMSVNDASKKVSITETDLSFPNVFSILQDRQGALWFGSFGSGLVKWEKKWKSNNDFDFSNAKHYKSDLNNEYSIGGDFVSCLFEDSKGNLWVGALQGGLSVLVKGKNGNNDRFVTYSHNLNNPNSLSHNSVFAIHEDKDGNYWIGTFGGGLNKMILSENGNPVFEHFSEEDGLANNAVYGILEDESGKLWMSTDNGISCFNPKDKTFKNFNKGDGLQSNNFRKNAYYKNKHDYLFFGGLRGLNIFHPKNLKDNDILAEPKLTGFKIKNELVEIGKEYNGRVILNHEKSDLGDDLVKLKHHENTLTFEFAALHYAAPEKNKFQYQLVGFDNVWQDAKGLSFAHYTNLSPGTYTFIVKASNNDGVWSEVSTLFNFRISPPFWYTWWAFVLYILLLTGVIFAIISYLSLQEKEKAAVKVQKEIEQVNRLKLQFFTNISHEFKTPITLILNPIEELLESIGSNVSMKPKLQIIQRNANSLLRLVHQLMEFRKIEVGETKLGATKSNIVNFVREMTYSFKSSAKKNELDISFESDLKTSEIWFDWDKLEKILNNLIFNAIKFTNPGGQIKVIVSKDIGTNEIKINDKDFSVNYLKIEVEDDGVGISKEELPFVFHRFYQVNQTRKRTRKGSGIGLAITKDLVELHHGIIEVDSIQGKGTTFTIKLPMGSEHLLPEEMIETAVSDVVTNFDVELEESMEELEFDQDSAEAKLENTVLVVDDNLDIRLLIKEGFLGSYNVLVAENGKEGLNIALKEMPDLIISDILMPEMDGIELCGALKTNIRTSHIPIILLTALNSVEHRIEGLESGADAYIPKPFKMKLLSVRAEKLIETRDLMRKRFQTEKELTPEKVTLNSLDEEFLKKIMDLMEENMSNDSYWVDDLVSDMNTSRSTFFRKLKKLTGQSPNDFIRMVRLKRAAQLLEQNELTIAQVSYRVGFADPGYFGKCFRKFFGDSPSNFVKKKTLS
ncbi:hybrid sensor histidine kinase/response regulator transcription factor [Seonamhaeicola maritimus]|uniref:histidine kinase n=1 Tax=Seonamhaeicola maritimus TaxID=2591822 RepID=A0A5C7GK02_9FLAO|nr:two-component regulator propeller domain-containing protein [Seonamhaeicola maritimus]TXG38643.1 response regulator [Seonamhaeicola maritimus]